MHDYENASIYYEKSLNCDQLSLSDAMSLTIVNYGYCLLNTGREQDALVFSTKVYPLFEFLADFLFLMGVIYLKTEQYAKALLHFIKATATEQCLAIGSNSFIARYYMGLTYEMMVQNDMALYFYKLCDDYQPAVNRINKITDR